MLTVTTIQNLCIIVYVSGINPHSFVYSFKDDFLPAKTIEKIRRLPAFSNRHSCLYILTAKQEQEAIDLFRKINEEKKSDYTFAEDLERVYLLQLVHLIVKAHEKKMADCKVSLN
ncbi:MAG: hypothetical protein QM731_22065 [Chitinophagaceae bacterium]